MPECSLYRGDILIKTVANSPFHLPSAKAGQSSCGPSGEEVAKVAILCHPQDALVAIVATLWNPLDAPVALVMPQATFSAQQSV